ncbi:lytic transglycosylase domain-containing protein [Nocardia tengchongensis]|uniref:lytic transglycosylase domain-containing protein n=1 Tax=Nocardia tengchongensis TaxID=2055889 RepID=UPI0036B85B3E
MGIRRCRAGGDAPQNTTPQSTSPQYTTPQASGGDGAGTTGTGASNNTSKGANTLNSGKSSDYDAYAAQYGASPSVVAAVKGAAADLYGWGKGAQWQALDQLIAHESSWNPDASAEPASDAYGLYQFLSTTWATAHGSKTSDPKLQAVYGNNYIKQRYGDPMSAWSFWNSHTPHWYAAGGDVFGEGSSISDSIPAMLSNGEFVVNAQSADRHRSLLHAINTDNTRSQALTLRQTIPAKGLVGAGVSRGGMDNSTTINVHTADTETGFWQAQLYQQQRAATYTSRWR